MVMVELLSSLSKLILRKKCHAEDTHLEFKFEAGLQLIDHVHITCQNDDVFYTYNYNPNVVASL